MKDSDKHKNIYESNIKVFFKDIDNEKQNAFDFAKWLCECNETKNYGIKMEITNELEDRIILKATPL